jgi:hypothetical protein
MWPVRVGEGQEAEEEVGRPVEPADDSAPPRPLPSVRCVLWTPSVWPSVVSGQLVVVGRPWFGFEGSGSTRSWHVRGAPRGLALGVRGALFLPDDER